MFFDGQSDEPIRVDGTMTVYAFDGTSANSAGTVPERKFVFLAEDLPKHFSESKLGPSYSFWLPWDELGGYERQLTLVTRFEPVNGAPAMSQPSRHYLPGLPKPNPQPESAAAGPGSAAAAPQSAAARAPSTQGQAAPTGQNTYAVQAASHTEAAEAPVGPRMSTYTIDVPPSFMRHTRGKQDESAASAATRSGGRQGAEPSSTAPSAPAAEVRPAEQRSAPGAEAENGEGDARSASSRFPQRDVMPRSQVRREPLRANWLPALPPTPRSSWARATSDRWPGMRPDSEPGQRSWDEDYSPPLGAEVVSPAAQ